MSATVKQIESLGYVVTTHRMGDYIELHAVPLGDGELKIARIEGDGENELYRVECALAEMVGIGLEDG